MNWRRLWGTKITRRGDVVVRESLRGELAMPLANVKSIHVEWVPDGAPRLILTSNVGNTISIFVVEDTAEIRAGIGAYVTATPLDRWLTDATRTALLLDHRLR